MTIIEHFKYYQDETLLKKFHQNYLYNITNPYLKSFEEATNYERVTAYLEFANGKRLEQKGLYCLCGMGIEKRYHRNINIIRRRLNDTMIVFLEEIFGFRGKMISVEEAMIDHNISEDDLVEIYKVISQMRPGGFWSSPRKSQIISNRDQGNEDPNNSTYDYDILL